jgi:Tfp pilus assembly protein PilF
MNKKNLVIMLIICAVSLAFAGCSTDMARIDYDKRINTAFGQLQNGQSTQAIRNLEVASKIGEENDYDQTELKRLFVETHLGLGNNVEAYNQAKALLDEEPQDAYANELMGKVLLKEGQYSAAEAHFVTAQQTYEAPVDVSRINDLIALARYFTAYHNGNPRLAKDYLREIQNADLQYAVDKAEKDIIVKNIN